jgi:dipeptidase E
MAAPRLLLLSNSRNVGQGYLEHAGDAITDFLGGVKTALFIPYAAVRVSYDDFTALAGARLRELGCEIAPIHRMRSARAAVLRAEAIIVGGGNTFRLIQLLHRRKLVTAIRSRVRAGIPYIGWSAGANVACPTIRTTNDMPIVEPLSLNAMGLVPFQINPHYLDGHPAGHGGETREERLLEFIAANPAVHVVGLREGSILRVEGRRLTLLGGKPARIFRGGREPWEVAPSDDLRFVMR